MCNNCCSRCACNNTWNSGQVAVLFTRQFAVSDATSENVNAAVTAAAWRPDATSEHVNAAVTAAAWRPDAMSEHVNAAVTTAAWRPDAMSEHVNAAVTAAAWRPDAKSEHVNAAVAADRCSPIYNENQDLKTDDFFSWGNYIFIDHPHSYNKQDKRICTLLSVIKQIYILNKIDNLNAETEYYKT